MGTDYLTKMGIKTVPHLSYSPDLASCDFWLFPKLRGCRYETIEEMKEAVTKVIDTLTQEDFCGAFQMLLHIVLLKCPHVQIAFLKFTNCDNQALVGCIPIPAIAVRLKLKL